MVEAKSIEAGLYLVRSGKVRIYNKSKSRDEILGEGDYFGEGLLMTDAKRNSNGPDDPTTCKPGYTVEVTEDCICGILKLAVLRNCLDTTMLGKPQTAFLDSLVTKQIPMTELMKHTILGMLQSNFLIVLFRTARLTECLPNPGNGTFGQVWLVCSIQGA